MKKIAYALLMYPKCNPNQEIKKVMQQEPIKDDKPT